jgi:nitrous oxidase accessory protein NosD
MLVLVVLGVVGWARGWFQSGGPAVAQNHHGETAAGDSDKASPAPAATANPKPPAVVDDPNVLTVSRDEKDGGKYRTINDALKNVAPGQTVLVLDDATYSETLELTQASRYNGITLASTRRATLAIPDGTRVGVRIVNVTGVILLGFRVKGTASVEGLILVTGRVPGVILEDLDLDVAPSKQCGAVSLEEVRLEPGMSVLTVRNCRFQGGFTGLQVASRTTPSAGIVIRENKFRGTIRGLVVRGKVSRTQIVANCFIGAPGGGIQLSELDDMTGDLLIANNSFMENMAAVVLGDSAVKGHDIQLRNNLILGAVQPDITFVKCTGQASDPGKPGDGTQVAKAWQISYNWREIKPPAEGTDERRAWVPPDAKKGDVRQDEIKGVNRDPKSPDFLRPDPNSRLATEGAGTEDPSLPRYVGALPPIGTALWDWDRAGRMPKTAQLLTVSKDPKVGGTYRTIADALKDAKPWTTIRVLDSATYEEDISLTDRKKYEGLTLEAVRSATLLVASGKWRLITIEDVPDVCVTGFRCSDSGSTTPDAASRAFVAVSGKAQGITLTRLVLTPKTPMLGISLQNALAPPGERPLRIEQCTIQPQCPLSNAGITVAGTLGPDAAGGICIRSNRILGCSHGISLLGALHDVHVTGNIVVKSPFSGLQMGAVAPGSHGLLLANNTAFAGGTGFRVWDNSPYKELQPGQVEIANNLFFAATECDMGFILQDLKNRSQSPGNGEELLKMWRFHHNRRDRSGSAAAFAFLMPDSLDDGPFKGDEMLSIAKEDLDRVRPRKGSSLATQGAGTKDTSLPSYIGALPCEGEAEWNWDRTWRARVKNVREKR